MIGVIPVAGKGTRLGELVKEIPKALVKVDGITLLERTINSLKEVDVEKIYVIVGYKKEQIIEFLKKDFGVGIETIVQENLNGVANAIKQVERYVNEPFIVHLPDNILENYGNLIEEFNKNNPDYIQLYRPEGKIPKNKSYFKIEKDNSISDCMRSDDDKIIGTRGIGIYIMKPVFFEYCNKIIKTKDEELNEIEVLSEMIEDGKKAMGVEYKGKFIDITNEKDIKR